jgi:hypothetical protein
VFIFNKDICIFNIAIYLFLLEGELVNMQHLQNTNNSVNSSNAVNINPGTTTDRLLLVNQIHFINESEQNKYIERILDMYDNYEKCYHCL